jgi:hypothetical protein
MRVEKRSIYSRLCCTYVCPYIKAEMLENKQMLHELDEIY